MTDVQVTCINKANRENQYTGITHLGSSTGNWRWTRQEVIVSIENKTNTFFTLVHGNRSEIGVVDGPTGKYLRTYADGDWNDNLLSLPECPT